MRCNAFYAFTLTLALSTLPTHGKGRVLILGDSLSVAEGQGLGNQLDFRLRKEGYSVTTMAACGSKPSDFADATTWQTRCGFLFRQASLPQPTPGQLRRRGWFAGHRKWENAHETYVAYFPSLKRPQSVESFSELIARSAVKDREDLVILQQGTNLFSTLMGPPANPQAVKEAVKGMLATLDQKAPEAKCLWVAPPKVLKINDSVVPELTKTQMFTLIRDAIGEHSRARGLKAARCEILDSRNVTENPDAKDGTHFNPKTRNTAWVDEAFKRAKDLLPSAPTAVTEQGAHSSSF